MIKKYLREFCWFGVGVFFWPTLVSFLVLAIDWVMVAGALTCLCLWYFAVPRVEGERLGNGSEISWFAIGTVAFVAAGHLTQGQYFRLLVDAGLIYINWWIWHRGRQS
jgi:hypothetical protein